MAMMNLGPRRRGKKSERAKLITKLDQVVSLKVRQRDGGCIMCGSPRAYCHHIFSRRHLGTRWDMDNLVSLCLYHHRYTAHGDPEAFRDFIIKRIGEQKFNSLKIKAYSHAKLRESDLLLMLQMMKCEVCQRPEYAEAF